MSRSKITVPPPPTRYGRSTAQPASKPGPPRPSPPPAPRPVPPAAPQARPAPTPPSRAVPPAPALAAQPSAEVIQAARLSALNSRPDGAQGSVKRFKLGHTWHLADSRNKVWYWHPTGHWVSKKKISVPSYNRFKAVGSGRGAPRMASFRSRKGSGARYYPKQHTGGTKATPITGIRDASKAKRTYVANMLNATTAEGFPTGSATTYAALHGAPVIAGGYNWCHLIGHGGGGSDQATNLVAASTHANSEQLEIEKIVYRYKKKGVAARVTAKLKTGALHLADALVFEVFYNGNLIFQRIIDGYRADKPSYIEMAAVEVKLSKAIYDAAGG